MGQGARPGPDQGARGGEHSLFDTIEGAIELGVPYLSAYAFSTENWRRSPEEVRFLMGFNRDVIHRRRDDLAAMGVRIVWSGRAGRLWKSVIGELTTAEEMSQKNTKLTLQFCVNYGGQAEIADAAQAIARDVAAGRIKPEKVNEKLIAKYLYHPEIPEVDLFLRPSGEQRISNFLLWQSAYARWSTWTRSGPISTAATSGTPASSTPSGTAASEARCRTRCPRPSPTRMTDDSVHLCAIRNRDP